MMEIILSRLEDEPTDQSQFEVTRFEGSYGKSNEKLGNILGTSCKLPRDLGNAAARGRHPSPQNQGGFEKRHLNVKT